MSEDPRISEIRAVLDEYVRPDDLDALHAVRRRIRAILDRPWRPSVGEKVTGIETQTIGRPTVTGWFHSSGADGLSWLKIHEHDPETAQRYLVGTETLRPCPAPAPRVFLPNERVPVGAVITGKDGSPFRVPDVYASEGLVGVAVPFVEVTVPTPEEWQAAVDRARAERGEADRG